MKHKHLKAYMDCCYAFANCSSGKRLKVGSVIVKNNRIISCGYNALPEHIDGPLEEEVYDGTNYTLVTKPEVRHAEKNAFMGLVKNNETAIGATMFCTHCCCYFCAVDIVDAGIKTFIYDEEYRGREGIEYLSTNGVEVIKWSECESRS